jgi:molybdenum cofactor synthesis domain-containing protein
MRRRARFVKRRVAVITASDKGARGERVDESGALVREMAAAAGFEVVRAVVLPDEQALLEKEMRRIADRGEADLILTTGGTGFSERDVTPEATLAVAARVVPGIAEAMRASSMAFTKRAMLSRAVSVIRKKTLIINLPGSPKAVRENLSYIMPEMEHALGILCADAAECAR